MAPETDKNVKEFAKSVLADVIRLKVLRRGPPTFVGAP